jgi:hypothetical protein
VSFIAPLNYLNAAAKTLVGLTSAVPTPLVHCILNADVELIAEPLDKKLSLQKPKKL